MSLPLPELRAIRPYPRLAAVLAATLAAMLAGCGGGGNPAYSSDLEVARVLSPDARLEAVLTETNPNATTSFVYRIWVVPRGGAWQALPAAAELYGATRNDNAYGVNLRWHDRRTVLAEYLKAYDVRPAGLIAPATAGGREVRVYLRPGTADPSAPAGSMRQARAAVAR